MNKPARSWWYEYVGGAAAGIATLLVGQPFDTVKVRLQSGTGSGILSVLRACAHSESWGLLALYKGTSPQLLGASVQHAVRYGSYGASKQWLLERDYFSQSPFRLGACAGLFTGCCVTIVAQPIELIKCRQQINRHSWLSLIGALRGTSLTRGLGATFLRSTSGNMAAFSAFEGAKDSGAPTWAAGALAGVAFWTVGWPADVVKSRIQTGVAVDKGGLLEVLREVNRLGARRLTRGFSTVIARALVVNAAAFQTHEVVSGIVGRTGLE